MAGKQHPGVRGPGGPSNEPRGTTRQNLEQRSFPMLAFLTRVPKWLLIVTMAGLLFAGFVLPALIGAFLLFLVVLFLIWLVALSWPVLNTSSKLLRVIVIIALLGIVVFKSMGRL